jgi:hypothetical protein
MVPGTGLVSVLGLWGLCTSEESSHVYWKGEREGGVAVTERVVLEYWQMVEDDAAIDRLRKGIFTTIVSLQPGEVVHT